MGEAHFMAIVTLSLTAAVTPKCAEESLGIKLEIQMLSVTV